jgi:hypothetical protein
MLDFVGGVVFDQSCTVESLALMFRDVIPNMSVTL